MIFSRRQGQNSDVIQGETYHIGQTKSTRICLLCGVSSRNSTRGATATETLLNNKPVDLHFGVQLKKINNPPNDQSDLVIFVANPSVIAFFMSDYVFNRSMSLIATMKYTDTVQDSFACLYHRLIVVFDLLMAEYAHQYMFFCCFHLLYSSAAIFCTPKCRKRNCPQLIESICCLVVVLLDNLSHTKSPKACFLCCFCSSSSFLPSSMNHLFVTLRSLFDCRVVAEAMSRSLACSCAMTTGCVL